MPSAVTDEEVCQLLGVSSLSEVRKFCLANGETAMLDGLDSGIKSYIAKRLAEVLATKQGAVLCMLEWGVWSSSEIPEMFYRIRLSQGFPHQVWEVRAEKIQPDEEGYMACLLGHALYSIWSFVAISLDRSLVVHFSNDEGMDVITSDLNLRSELLTMLGKR